MVMFLVSDEKQQELGETKWRKEVQLYNKHGYNLGIFPGGFVRWVPGARWPLCRDSIYLSRGRGRPTACTASWRSPASGTGRCG